MVFVAAGLYTGFFPNFLEEILVSLERTFAIIKPDAVAAGQQGEILSRIHKAGFKIIAVKSMRLDRKSVV